MSKLYHCARKELQLENIKKHDFYIKGKKIFEEIFTIEKNCFRNTKRFKM